MAHKPLRILLVDDNEDDVFLMTEAFAACEFPTQITPARDGFEALDLLQQRDRDGRPGRPDVVLLDINMPRLDGFGVLEALREDKALADLPVVVLTTSEADDDCDRALRLGARECLHKPVGFDRLCELARQFAARWADPPAPPRRPLVSG